LIVLRALVMSLESESVTPWLPNHPIF